ncbi:MAG: hypothetical protein Q7V01_04625 [Vicinamibacterales bacterium]|nr:hypothetical protein [Vicinamibacterales bacterium]
MFVALAVLLIAVVAGGLWMVREQASLDRSLQSSAVHDDLHGAHASLLGARVDLYERRYGAAGRKLEEARALLRRAHARSVVRRTDVAVTPGDLANFEADLDEARRLLARLDQEADTPAIRGTVDRASGPK